LIKCPTPNVPRDELANNADAPLTNTTRKVCAKKEYLRYRVWYLAAERDWTVLIVLECQLTLGTHTQRYNEMNQGLYNSYTGLETSL